MKSYNVWHEPWIPAVDVQGRSVELGIQSLLEKAHELREIRDPSPAISFGIYRLLITLVMDAFSIDTLEGMERLLNHGRFSPAKLTEYQQKCGPVFDLFDAKHPFLQSANDWEEAESQPIARLLQHLPSGTFATLFHHGRQEDCGLSPASCVKALCAAASFMTSGGAGYSPSVNGDPPWYGLIRGETLFETLVLNGVGLPMTVPATRGVPNWRAKRNIKPKEEVTRIGLLEGLTWPSRRIRLVPDADPDHGAPPRICSYLGRPTTTLISTMYFEPGLKAASGADGWRDPSVPYKITDKGRFSLGLEEGRQLWRDIGPLTLLREKDYAGAAGRIRFERPLLVSQFQQLKEEGILEATRPLILECYGIRTDGKMKIFEWQCETLSVPPEILGKPDGGRQIQEALDQAQNLEYHLGQALRKAYPREGNGNRNAFERLITACHTAFWSALRPQFQDEFLHRLSTQDPARLEAPDELATWWRGILRQTGLKALEQGLDQLDANAQALCRQVAARNYFWKALGNMDPNKPKKKSNEKPKTTTAKAGKEAS